MKGGLAAAQREMAAFLRHPQGECPPAGIEPRRLQVYRDLVYNNIEGFISSAFPVLRSLYTDAAWEALVREFIRDHRCSTPLFLQISEEFLAFLGGREPPAARPFEPELAHYEWLELAVDVAEGDVAARAEGVTVDDSRAELCSTARLGIYDFPVHRIGPSFQPDSVAAQTCLLVYRDRDDAVQFMELSTGSARLLQEVAAAPASGVTQVLGRLAEEWGMEPAAMIAHGWEQLRQFNEIGVIRLLPVGA